MPGRGSGTPGPACLSSPNPAAARAGTGTRVSKSAALTGAPSVNGASADRRIGRLAQAEVDVVAADRERVAQAAHHDAQRDVDDVVAGPAAVREAREVAAGNTERALRAAGVAAIAVLRRIISEGVTVACWFTPAKPVRNAVTRSRRGRFAGREVRDVRAERRVDRVAEQHVDQRRQRRVRHVGRELAVVRRLAGVELVLVRQPDDDFVDERVPEARHLHPRAAAVTGPASPTARSSTRACAAMPSSSRRSRRCRSPSRHCFGSSSASVVMFLSAIVSFAGSWVMPPGNVAAVDRHDVHEVEHLAEVHRERLVALADEHAPGRRAAGNRDRGR